MKDFTHTGSDSKAKMVDVTTKDETLRQAEAFAEVLVSGEVFRKIKKNEIEKGDVLSTAKLAGIQAAKKTYELIPLCHNIFISNVDLNFRFNTKRKSIEIRTIVKTVSKTGVEMEAMTAASVAALTIYDMCKALDKSITISEIKLISKSGGKSGDYKVSKK